MRVFVPSVIFSTTVLLLLGGISYANEENVNAMVSSESNQQLPGNAPPDADKRRSAQNAKETMLRGESSGTGNVTLEELKALMEMGIDELVVRDEEIADGDIANASDDTEGSNGVDYSKDGASSHKQEVNHQPKSASAVVANAAKIQQQGEEEYDEEDEFDESVYEQELAKFLADQNFVDETRDLDEEDMDGGLNNGTEATSRRHLRYLHSKKIELPSIYIHGNDKHNEDNKNNNETRRLQNLSTSTIGTFAPLSCNLPSLPTTSQCHKTPTGLFSTLVNAANGAPITIPCGTCYKYDLPWGRTFELGGLDIIGKLYIPPNWKTVIKTPYIFVQGELEIINNRLITPDNLSTRIILTGESDVWFRPADSNQGVEGTPFNAGKKPLLVAGGKLNIRGWDRDDTSSTLSDEASYTTWSPILSKTADGTFALRDDETGISSRWGPMSEIHITSSTLSSLDGHDAVLSTISPNADGITASITLQTPVDTTTTPITSEEESPGRGAEVTLLSRNIVIEGEFLSTDTYPTQSGGYLQILHTPGVSQIIEGVDFQNMGQELGKNRFPIQFLYNGDVLGSSVARNTIRNSNHRCIVVEGTSNVTVASNVAYETAGHCYFFGHESVDNIVRGNIGVRTNDVIGSGSQLDGHSDHSRATFFLWSPINEYIGNVAAGGDGRGFYMYNNAKTLGEDLVSTSNGNLRRVAMKTFKDNKSHSNVWQGFVFYNFEQYYTFGDDINIPLFENTMAYRNQQHGILGNNLHGAMFRGGILADNQWGMRIPRSDGIKIEDFQIMGYTDVVGDVTASNDKIKLCARSSWNLQGIIMMNTRWMYGEHVLGYGMRMKNVTFSDFDKNTGSCASSWPIAMDSYKYYDTHFDYLSSWENVRVVDSRGYVLDGCGAMQTYGFYDVVINDLYGSLDRTGLSTGPSALVSNTPALTKLLGNKCSAHTDSCMAYCSGVCMQSFYYNVEQFRSETWKLVITDANGESTEISGSIEAVDDYSFSDAFRYTKFPVALPAGTYTARFVDELGDLVWPTFVEEVWEEPPACAGSAKPEDIKFVKPEISDDCDDLFRLEDTGTTNPWIHTDTGVEVAIGMGISGTDAIRTSNRRYSWTGFGQNIDTRCIDLRPNQYYEFAALIKLTDTSGNPALDTVIDPNVQWDLNKSPIMTLSAREYRDAASLIYF